MVCNRSFVSLLRFREGHVAVAEQLLLHGADVELPDNYGQSPLFMACWKGIYLLLSIDSMGTYCDLI